MILDGISQFCITLQSLEIPHRQLTQLFMVKIVFSAMKMCSSRKKPYPPHGRTLEIPRGRGGVLKAKFLEAIYENKLEFLGGKGGAKQKNLLGKYGYFLGLHNYFENRFLSNTFHIRGHLCFEQ